MKNPPWFLESRRLRHVKLAPVLAVASMSCLLAACGSLDNPLTGLFRSTGRDGRTYNAATGQYEWPEESKQRRRPQKAAQIAAELQAQATPAPPKKSGERYYDPVKRQFVDAEPEEAKPQKKAKATPVPAVAQATPKPVPEKSSGVYNMDTGKFDWSPSGVPSTGSGKNQQ